MTDRFRYFASEPLAVIPAGATMTLSVKTTTELINEREEWLENTVECSACHGHGRVHSPPKAQAGIVPLADCPFCGCPPVQLMETEELSALICCSNDDCMGARISAANLQDATVKWNTRTSATKAEAAPLMVKPLEWLACADDTHHDTGCQYEVEQLGKYWRVVRGVTCGGSYICDAATLDGAKAAAQADYEQRIRSALAGSGLQGNSRH